MGRPLYKMNKKSLKFIIENSGKMSFAKMAEHLGVHHTTILYWVRKLADRGMVVTARKGGQSEADELITEVKKEFGV